MKLFSSLDAIVEDGREPEEAMVLPKDDVTLRRRSPKREDIERPLDRRLSSVRMMPGGYYPPGSNVWFEYHCYEGEDSADADLWYRSHQRVTVLELEEKGYGGTPAKRGDNGQPAVYSIKFEDGFVGSAFEDELGYTRKFFCRPDPPKKSSIDLSISKRADAVSETFHENGRSPEYDPGPPSRETNVLDPDQGGLVGKNRDYEWFSQDSLIALPRLVDGMFPSTYSSRVDLYEDTKDSKRIRPQRRMMFHRNWWDDEPLGESHDLGLGVRDDLRPEDSGSAFPPRSQASMDKATFSLELPSTKA